MAIAGSGLIFGVTATPAGAAPTWTAETPGVTANFAAISFANTDDGWAVGSAGHITGTVNGGTSWTPVTPVNGNTLNSVSTVDATHAWAVGNSGTIIATSNGTSWAAQTSNVATNLDGVSFVNDNDGCAVGAGGTIDCTVNGGTTWTPETSVAFGLFSVSFVNPSDGWAAGVDGSIYATTNGGVNWSPEISPITNAISSIDFVDTSHGHAVSDGGDILSTLDGGITWTAQTSGVTTPLNGVSFSSDTDGFAVGDGGVILGTNDDGQTWTPETSGTTNDLNSVSAVDLTDAWTAGANTTILGFSNPNTNTVTHFSVVPSTTTVIAGGTMNVTVDALDAFDHIVPGYLGTVHFTSSDPQAVLPLDSTLTAGTGTFNVILKTATAPPEAGGPPNQIIIATDVANPTINGDTVPITVDPAMATHFVITGTPSTISSGTSFPLTVTATDPFGNTDNLYAGTVHFTTTDPGAVTLPANTTLTAGVKSLNAILVTAGTQTITATDTVTSSITCTSPGILVTPAAATHLVVTAPANATAGVPFNFTVTAEDASNNVQPGYTGTVTFTSTDGAAVLPANFAFTAANNGVATFSATLKTVGSKTITATDTVTATITGTSGAINVVAGPVTTFVLNGIPGTVAAGTAVPFTVTAKDAFGNTATSYNGAAHFTSTDPLASLPGNIVFVAGVTASISATFGTVGSQTLTATDVGTGTIHVTSAPIIVTSGPATHLTITAFPSTVAAGTPFSFTINAVDQFGNIATTFPNTDSLTVNSTDPTFGNHTGVHLTAGTRTIPGAVMDTAGTQTITAVDITNPGVTGVTSGPILVTAGPAVSFKVVAPPTATAGVPFTFTVQALDAHNNTATGYTGLVNFTSTDPLAVLPAINNLNNGVGTFTATLKTSGSQTITATDTVTSSITGTSGAILVSSAGATHLKLVYPASVTAGVSNTLSITALDAFNNTATGYNGTVTITSSDPTATLGAALLPQPTTLVNGLGSVSITLKTAGVQTITATDTVNASITGTVSTTVNPASAGAIHFVVTAPSPEAAGTSFTTTVTAEDAFNNVDTTYAGTVKITSTDPAAILPANHTLTAGVGTFTVTLNTAGSQTVTATDTVTSSITGSTTVVVTPGPVTHLVVTATSPEIAGVSFPVTVKAEDASSNVVTTFPDTVQLTSSDGAAVLPIAAPLTAGVGTFTVTLKTAGVQSITATDLANPGINGTTNVTVDAAPATVLVVTAPVSVTAGVPFSTVQVHAFDQFGNPDNSGPNSDTDVVHFTSTDPLAVAPPDTALVAGAGTFTVTLKTAGTQTITFTSVPHPSVTGSTNIKVIPNVAVGFTVSAPANAVAGTPFNYTVTALDAFGNVATGFTDPIHFTSSDAQAVLPGTSNLTLGVGTFTATLKTSGTQTLSAIDTPHPTIFGTASILVAPAPATHFVLVAPPTTQAGVPFSFTDTAYDQFGNVDTNYNKFVHILSSDPLATLPNNVSLTNGVGHFTATFVTQGVQTLSSTDVIISTITGSTNILVLPGPATHFGLSAPGTALVGSPINVTVTALDQFGNVATAYTGTVHFTSSDALATLPADSTLTNGIKVFSVTMRTTGNQTITATDTVNPSITGTTPVVLVYPPPINGYDLAGADGGVFALGAEPYEGSLGGKILNSPIVGIALTPDGNGYWIVGGDGGVFTFGDAGYYGSTGALHLNKPIVGIARTPSGKGYWLVASDGGIFAFGDAQFWGSTGSLHLNKPIVGIATTPSGLGYWLVASDGGLFAFGDAQYLGSLGDDVLNQPIVGIATTFTGLGYWMVAADGGVFTFGDAKYFGSLPAMNFPVSQPAPAFHNDVVGIAPTSDLGGYWIVERDATVHPFGDATEFGPPLNNAGFAPDDIVGIATGPSTAEAF